MTGSASANRPGATGAELPPGLPEGCLKPVDDHYLQEPRGRFHGRALALAAPRGVEEVAAVVRAASGGGVPIVPYGGGTGLVGGQVAPEGPSPILLSLERMAAIREVRADEAVLIAEAGAILADIQQAAAEAGLLFPLSLAAEGTCRIGGNLATNAGGLNVLRYGNARDLCLGLEAVLPSGEIWHGLKRLRKDNTGYDLRHLLIGSEGTLGVITAAVLRLFPRPAAEGTAVFAVAGPDAALRLLAMTRDEVGEGVSAFELVSRRSFEFLAETMPEVRRPFADPPDWAVLVDLGLPRGLSPEAVLTAVFERAVEAGLVADGVIAQSQAQRSEFWRFRESIPEANRHVGAVASHDVSVPLGALGDFVADAKAAVARLGAFRVNCFGHVGDGNLHFNVFPPAGETKQDHAGRRAEITAAVHEAALACDGSISAEHGIGRLKADELERRADPARLAAMRAIKRALDPRGIMNPGAVLKL